MSNQLVPGVYNYVIDEVCDSVSTTFAEMGVGQNILAEMRQVWKQKISGMRVADFDFKDEEDDGYDDYETDYYPADGVDHDASFTTTGAEGDDGLESGASLEWTQYASHHTGLTDGHISTEEDVKIIPQEDGAPDDGAPSSSSAAVPSRVAIDRMIEKQWAQARDETARKLAKRRIRQLDGVDDDEEEDEDDDNDDGINSELDDEDSEDEAADTPDLILCQYEKVNRVKNKWKCALKDGIVTVDGRDYLFNKANGEFEW
ncbi:transcription factor IIA, alpha/beta subunit-domain-containing protein [Fimicolochytrium jonesii]|uniref:transcription factor IIA, alpha/beta subunit-domain-containing protein n=1 Tax=Fimicolochytrium jonesii TaxID=1396493 RepID=UPI0022FE4B33|nr:transcription factor IIA, alpha/beta subunit-domain-containing protein [Fimicolochytrium jonesii]KAI8824139.1 transcription factor IIA, alpha/beta subunit-domain-containing protein [Fimicolochytrium jonesii]